MVVLVFNVGTFMLVSLRIATALLILFRNIFSIFSNDTNYVFTTMLKYEKERLLTLKYI